MGTMNHNAVIATTWNKDFVTEIEYWMKAYSYDARFRKMFIVSEALVNGYVTVVCVPDGSKEGWSDSDYGDKVRKMFIDKMTSMAYENDGNCWSWVEVSFGEYGQKIVQGNCQVERND